MTNETLNTIVRASASAGNDDTRCHLQTVRLTAPDADTVRVTATNGHLLSDQILQDSALAALLKDKPAYVFRQSFAALKLLRDTWPNIFSFPTAVADDGNIEVGFKGVVVTLYRDLESGEYPDIDLVIPKAIENAVQVSFDAAYLLRLAKAGAQSPIHPRVTIEFDGKDRMKPILVRALNGRQIGVLMPCRSN